MRTKTIICVVGAAAACWGLTLAASAVSDRESPEFIPQILFRRIARVPVAGTSGWSSFDEIGQRVGSPLRHGYNVFDIARQQPVWSAAVDKHQYGGNIAVHGGRRLIAYGGERGTVTLCDLDSGRTLWKQVAGRRIWVTDLAFAHSGKLLAACCGAPHHTRMGGSVGVWDVETGKRLLAVSDFVESAFCLTISPDEDLLCVGRQYGPTIRVWSLPDGIEQPGFETDKSQWISPGVTSLAVSPDGKWLAVGYGDCLKIWAFSTRRECLTVGDLRDETYVAWSGDGRYLLGINQSRGVLLECRGERFHELGRNLIRGGSAPVPIPGSLRFAVPDRRGMNIFTPTFPGKEGLPIEVPDVGN